MDSKKVYAKVFGERNTGTNFLNELLRRNTDLDVLEHGSNQPCIEKLQTLVLSHKDLEQQAQYLIMERLIDSQRALEATLNYGWKHAAVQPVKISLLPRFNKTLFICLIRNPWRFTTGLYSRPYNIIPQPSGSLKDFVLSPFIANERDGLLNCYLSSPVELWNQKVASYFEFQALFPSNIILAYYEELVADPRAFLSLINIFCTLRSDCNLPSSSTKSDKKCYIDYKQEALSYDPNVELSPEVFTAIASRLNHSLLQKTGYIKFLR